MGEAQERLDKAVGTVGAEVHAVFRHGLERGVIRGLGVPVELHVHAAWPLHHRVTPDRIREVADDHRRTVFPGRLECQVHVLDQVTVALLAERVRDRRSETKQRHRARRGLQQLRGGAARHRQYIYYHLGGAFAAEGGQETLGKTVDIGRRYVNMAGVVLRCHGHCGRCRERTAHHLAGQQRQCQGNLHHSFTHAHSPALSIGSKP
ncbi:hypothetical protein PS708_06023 [Pseudomonas fluorescens]|nr:hypothetical protein PS708_06023 [Pseudomonas fluorescens]